MFFINYRAILVCIIGYTSTLICMNKQVQELKLDWAVATCKHGRNEMEDKWKAVSPYGQA